MKKPSSKAGKTDVKKVGRKKAGNSAQVPIEQYEHKGEDRINIPHVGLVTPATDKETGKKTTYAYDPHLDPQLQWAGKAEHTSFKVPIVSLHVHERLDPKRIIETVKKEEKGPRQPSLFEQNKKPLREAIEFYKHREGWTNRLVAGDSLLVMNSLLEKEGMGGKIQMVYFDPPYGISYKSNFQAFANKRDVKERDEDLTAEPEMIKAFRDTWELGIHSYLTYLRDRLLLARELLSETGSIFVQISDENVHHVRELLDEVFTGGNFISLIPFRKKTMPLGTNFLEQTFDFILFYSKNKEQLKSKYRQLYMETSVEGDNHWNIAEFKNGVRKKLSNEEVNNHKLIAEKFDPCQLVSMSPIGFSQDRVFSIEVDNKTFLPPKGKSWKTDKIGVERLKKEKRLVPYEDGQTLRYRLPLL